MKATACLVTEIKVGYDGIVLANSKKAPLFKFPELI